MKKLLALLLVALPLAGATMSLYRPYGPERAIYRVDAIHDGDTLTLSRAGRSPFKVRILGINAPEVKGPFGKKEEFDGPEATTFLAGLCPVGSQVWLAYGPTRIDIYKRTLAHVFRVPDGLVISVEMAGAGHAKPYPHKGDLALYTDGIALAAGWAQAQRAGLWSRIQPTPAPTATPCPCPEGSDLPERPANGLILPEDAPRLWRRVRPCPDGSGTVDGTCPTPPTPTPTPAGVS